MNYRTVVVNGKFGLMEERITEGNHKSAVAFVKGTSKSAKLNTGWRIEVGEIERIVYADCSGDEPQMYYISKGERVIVRLATQADIDAQNNNKSEESETMNEKVNTTVSVFGVKRDDGYIQIHHSSDMSKVSVCRWLDGDYGFKDIQSDKEMNVIMMEDMARDAGIEVEDFVPVRVNFFRFESYDYGEHLDMIAMPEQYGKTPEFMAGSYCWLESDQDDDVSHLYIMDTLEELQNQGIEFELNIAYAIATAQSDAEVQIILDSFSGKIAVEKAEKENVTIAQDTPDFMLALALTSIPERLGSFSVIDRVMRDFRILKGLPQ